MAADKIFISGLRVRCIIGVNEVERLEKQDVVINLAIETDLSKPCRTDRFEDTLDYRELKKSIVTMAESSRFFLIEALAQAVADICLEKNMTQRVTVRVDKPFALRFAKSVAVEITRERTK